mgnify:CR=1 FL=1
MRRRLRYLRQFASVVVIFAIGLSLGVPVIRSEGPDDDKTYLPLVQSDSTGPATPGSPLIMTYEIPLAERMTGASALARADLLAAEPMPLPMLDTPPAANPAQTPETSSEPAERVGAFPGGLPDPQAEQLARQLYASEWAPPPETQALQAEQNVEAYGYGYPPPFTRFTVNQYSKMWTDFPWRAIGRLFFKIPGYSSTYSCTASVMYGRTLWTAGHCVYTPGRGWHTSMFFVPAYRNGSRPYGTFYATHLATSYDWYYRSDKGDDIGVVAVADNNGYKVSQYVGWLGFLYNAGSDQHFHAFGYPSNIGSTMYLIACAASTSRRDYYFSPATLGIGCDMQHGSSGGPWIVVYAPYASGNNNYVNGVVSYGYYGYPKELFGSYFGSVAKALYDWGVAR